MLKKLGVFAASSVLPLIVLAACGDGGETSDPGAPSLDAIETPDGPARGPDAPPAPPPAAPAAPPVDLGAPGARADLEFVDAGAGAVWLFPADEGVRVYLRARDMRPGAYSVGVHETGDCSESLYAGAGALMPDGALPRLEAGDDGAATLIAVLQNVSLARLLDGDRSALVISRPAGAGAVDQDSQRLACGEIFASEM